MVCVRPAVALRAFARGGGFYDRLELYLLVARFSELPPHVQSSLQMNAGNSWNVRSTIYPMSNVVAIVLFRPVG